jgi:arylformamidase
MTMSKPVFLHYDGESLDREYDNRAKVADFAAHLAAFEADSACARRELECRLDVPFGPCEAEVLDVFPAGPDAPVHLFIHGGYWRALDKRDFSYVANALVPAGAAAVVINYALMPAVTMDELVRQCRAALSWTWRNAASFGGDPERIHVSGHSAGGHLVAMLLATDWPAFEHGMPVDTVRSGVGISGLYDLEPIRLCFLNDDLGLDPDTCARNSPTLLERRCRGPLLLPVGGDEGPEYLRQTETLAGAWAGLGEPPRPMVMPGRNHFSIAAELARGDSDLSRALLAQMGLGQ